MFAITPELVKAHQRDLLVAGDRSRRVGRSTRLSSRFSVIPDVSALARAAMLRLRRDTEVVPGPFAPCPC